ncbi:type IV pilin protein [Marinobacterium sp. A346]|uniref:Type IV pilin protein n=2 Tax=Marinobacterium weihaiense TaxID=2851016 RepID=A0ABS6M9N6_9GAMM|nr:type IV pilin protein [Marinobacterium weihaiense]
MNLKTGREAGFTMIELMIVVVIIGILMAIAWPAYQNYVIKGNRAEGRAGIATVTQQLERCFTRYNSYNDTNCSFATGMTETERYNITLVNDANTYTVTATPQFADTECGTLTLKETGAKTSGNNDVCW